jgi:hypothetical protein
MQQDEIDVFVKRTQVFVDEDDIDGNAVESQKMHRASEAPVSLSKDRVQFTRSNTAPSLDEAVIHPSVLGSSVVPEIDEATAMPTSCQQGDTPSRPKSVSLPQELPLTTPEIVEVKLRSISANPSAAVPHPSSPRVANVGKWTQSPDFKLNAPPSKPSSLSSSASATPQSASASPHPPSSQTAPSAKRLGSGQLPSRGLSPLKLPSQRSNDNLLVEGHAPAKLPPIKLADAPKSPSQTSVI